MASIQPMTGDGIFRGPASKSPKIMKTIGQLFMELCDKHPEKIFQIEADTGEKESYAHAKQRAVRLACALKKRNLVQPGDTTMVCSENTIHNIIPILATIFLGGSAASIDPMESVEEMAGALAYSEPKIIFTEKKSAGMLKEAHKELEAKNNQRYQVAFFVIGADEKIDGDVERIEDFALPCPEENNFQLHPQDSFDTAIYVFTSGTTSLPKPVALSHYGVLHGFKCLVDEMDNVNPEVITHFASLYWISAILLTGVTLSHGGTKVIAPKIPALNLLEYIEKYQITFAFMPNTYTYDITNLPAEIIAQHDTSSLYSIAVAGSPMDASQLRKMRATLPQTKVTMIYGSTECTAISAFDLQDFKAYEEKILSSGKLVADVEVKIVDLETRCLLPANKVGEILVRSPYMMKGYYEKCIVIPKSPFDENGFLKTGDLGFFDSDNYLFVTDRINDTFKYKTYQVSPLSIERVLLEHAAVKNAVVFNVFHERDRNHAAAIVTLKPGFESSAEEIKAFANARLSEKNKIRAKVWIREQIPYETQTGKVQRARIRKEFSKKMQEESTQS
uniref:AMP-dependent synthetase/ligase domain-containing protein n=1 Tax=Dendroctonus ponderosae TaxID=77166 RepID=A0AAR5P2Z6_DENPD